LVWPSTVFGRAMRNSQELWIGVFGCDVLPGFLVSVVSACCSGWLGWAERTGLV
jgi:hypothetical protein